LAAIKDHAESRSIPVRGGRVPPIESGFSVTTGETKI
jgi:hypothetical protein